MRRRNNRTAHLSREFARTLHHSRARSKPLPCLRNLDRSPAPGIDRPRVTPPGDTSMRLSPHRSRVCSAGLVALALLIAACGSGGPERLRVRVDVDANANQNSPIAFAVLVVYDKAVFVELGKLTAAEWFQQSDQRLRDNPDMSQFDVIIREWMPGQKIATIDMKLQGKECRGLVFADYYAEGDHRMRFNPESGILVVLGEEGFSILKLDDN